jgi:hypothetical protein
MTRFLLVILGTAAMFNFLYNSTLPTGEDELVYHISLPAQWLHAGHIYSPRTNPNAFFPMNGELVTALMLKIGGWRLAKVFVWFSGILMAGALYLFGRKHAGLTVEGALWATAILYTMPCITSLNGTVSVDQLNLLFEIMSVYCIGDWDIVGGGFFAGLSLGTRPYSVAWVLAAMLCLLTSWEEWLTFGVIAAVWVLPYPIRNWYLTGNPFYPRAFWHGAAFDPYFKAMETAYTPHGVWKYLGLPWRLCWGIWGCGFTWVPAVRATDLVLFTFCGAILILTALVPMTLLNARYFSPLFPWLAILAAKGIES